MDDGREDSGGKLEVDSIYYFEPCVLAGLWHGQCSCLLVRPSQNPGMGTKCVDVRAGCHLGTGIDKMMAIALCTVEMDRKMSLVPAVVAAPNPSA